MSKKKKKNQKKHFDPNTKNLHHILWQARHWNVGYSKALRNHEYMKKLIPKDTLHAQIHSEIADIPVPSPQACKRAIIEIEQRLKDGMISFDDTIEQRIDLLLDIWSFDDYPRTVMALRWQKELVAKFYKGGS